MKKKQFTIKNLVKEKRLFRSRLWIIALLIILLSIALIGRLFDLQVIKHNHYSTLSKHNIISLEPVPPKRGLIYDRNGVLLANNAPVFSLMVTPDRVDNLKQELSQIETFIPLTPVDLDNFQKQLHQHRQFVEIPLKLKLTEQETALFAVHKYQFPGFSTKAELIREYPLNSTFSHTLGYVGRLNDQDLQTVSPSNYAGTNYIGKTGIEKYYEPLLHGKVGYRRVEIDSSGRIIRTLGYTPAKSGKNIYLTLDSRLQQAVENALGQNHGSIVAIDPNNGQILAMASTPGFDPNLFVNGISQNQYNQLQIQDGHPLYNRSILGLYSIGSTIKPFIGLEGLDSGVTNSTFQVYDPGWFRIPHTKHLFHCWMHGGHGWVNMHRAIVASCDTYFYNLAYHLGIQPIDHILNEFGFGQKTGVDLIGELSGTVPSPEYKLKATGTHWYTGDTVNTIIGQGFSQATPLQLASATAALAMHGQRFQPHLLYSTGGQLVPRTHQPSINLNNPSNWKTIISAMQDVIPHGTGYRFGRQKKYTVAAKTGTAQVRNDNGQFIDADKLPLNARPNSVFIAFAPVKKPQIAIAVIVEHNPEAAPTIARKVLDDYFLHKRKKSSAHRKT